MEFAPVPDVSVLVVNYNTQHLIDRMMASLAAGAGNLRLQIIVVDNNSKDESVALLSARYPEVELIRSEVNLGFGRANNLALTKARGRYVLLLNTDAFVGADALAQTVSFIEQHPRCGVLGVKLVGEDGSLQPCCRYFPTPWNSFLLRTGLQRLFPDTKMIDDLEWDHASTRACDWVPGCYYLIRREVIDQVGLFDPRFFMYSEEVDHCRRVRQAGWEVIFYPHVSVIHLGGESAKADGTPLDASQQISSLQIESELLYFRKHYGMAGVFTAFFLTFVADGLTAARHALKRSDLRRARLALAHAASTMRILVSTAWATRPTQ
ncbi:glycosyltransferase family 2 protein [Bradyrhizobium guangdongense]|uniref:Glycosyltransferase family 2 protein n=1 Tax=Bradyrhizobium guangdongense TaxID=1325090 RepID=A0ABX6UF89_9BRAD|nr:glycosyltransferase family 2 protein [Bradyrhizobium guangdongense]QOZ59554.1 glycosyltransferase family 2 protein [Bradyrhizobium guangdongense]